MRRRSPPRWPSSGSPRQRAQPRACMAASNCLPAASRDVSAARSTRSTGLPSSTLSAAIRRQFPDPGPSQLPFELECQARRVIVDGNPEHASLPLGLLLKHGPFQRRGRPESGPEGERSQGLAISIGRDAFREGGRSARGPGADRRAQCQRAGTIRAGRCRASSSSTATWSASSPGGPRPPSARPAPSPFRAGRRGYAPARRRPA